MKLVRIMDFRGIPMLINAEDIILAEERYDVDKETNIGLYRSRIYLKGRNRIVVNYSLDELMAIINQE